MYFAWRPNLADEAGNHLIELAVAGAAGFVVSRNQRLGSEASEARVRSLLSHLGPGRGFNHRSASLQVCRSGVRSLLSHLVQLAELREAVSLNRLRYPFPGEERDLTPSRDP